MMPARACRCWRLAALAEVGMEGKTDRHMGALFGGERQRVMMAQCLMPVPDLLVLDEPMAALDEAGARIFERLVGRLQERGATILWVEHDLAAVRRLAGRVTGLSRSVLFDGAPEAELTPERVLALFSHRTGGAHERLVEAFRQGVMALAADRYLPPWLAMALRSTRCWPASSPGRCWAGSARWSEAVGRAALTGVAIGILLGEPYHADGLPRTRRRSNFRSYAAAGLQARRRIHGL